ncbi:hypothetical protein ACETIH_00780 [Microvirga arabica]|uniref:Uncharacterized protein n=1 Tax=Microvirga arabica TaxID=1128671 RepID=A0ABV6Y216_9HYPH
MMTTLEREMEDLERRMANEGYQAGTRVTYGGAVQGTGAGGVYGVGPTTVHEDGRVTTGNTGLNWIEDDGTIISIANGVKYITTRSEWMDENGTKVVNLHITDGIFTQITEIRIAANGAKEETSLFNNGRATPRTPRGPSTLRNPDMTQLMLGWRE